MIVGDTAGPLPKGAGHIMSMALFASKFGDLDFTWKSILFLPSSPRGVGPIRVTTTPATLASSAPTPPSGGSIWGGRIRGYPVIIRGLAMTWEWPSHRWISSKTQSRTTPCQSMLNRVGSGCIILSGWLRSGLRLEWSSSSREGWVQLHRGKPVLEFPESSPQIFLLYSLTSHQDLTSLGDDYAPHSSPSKVSHPGGNVHDCFTSCDGLAKKKTCSRVCLLSIKGQHVASHA